LVQLSKMVEIRFHGRGGQGIATAAELFARSAAYEGKSVQSTPVFGAERRGALVSSYARVSQDMIWLREPVDKPNIVVVFDTTVLKEINVLDGITPGGHIIINTSKKPSELKEQLKTKVEVHTVDATRIAVDFTKRPMINTVILGALSQVTKLFTMDSIKRAVIYRFPKTDIEATMKAIDTSKKSVLVT